MGYTTTQRRNIGVDVFAGAYAERDIIGVGYVIEQATKLRKPVGEVDPSAYRCARTASPAEPYAARGHCNPDYTSVMSLLGNAKTILPFPLETTSAQALQAKLAAGTLTSQQLVKAYLTRIALANANGPAVQAVRAINPDALDELPRATPAARAAGRAARSTASPCWSTTRSASPAWRPARARSRCRTTSRPTTPPSWPSSRRRAR